jgi:hypothetical protein
MRLLPPSRIARVEFFETRIEPWTARATDLGLTAAELATLAAQAAAARAAFTAQQDAAAAARAATAAFHDALRTLERSGSAAIRTIRNQAAGGAGGGAGDPDVYVLARIPPPTTPTRRPRPGKPFDFRATLLPGGTLELTFKCRHAGRGAGTLYEVRRRVNPARDALRSSRTVAGAARCEVLGLTGRKAFRDDTLPAGAAEVTYEVTAVHSTGRGDSARYTVLIGVVAA